MAPKCSSSRGIQVACPSFVPLHCGSRAASHAGASRDCHPGGLLREVLLEEHAVVVGLFREGRVEGVDVLGVLEHLVGDVVGGVVLEAIDPAVTHAVAELLLLAVEDMLQHRQRLTVLVVSKKVCTKMIQTDQPVWITVHDEKSL